MHPADQFDAFYNLHMEQGLSDEDIAARFGVTPGVVKQRLKLAAVSPVLMGAYSSDILTLDQLIGYAITEIRGWNLNEVITSRIRFLNISSS